MPKFGFSDEEWLAAKQEAKSLLADRARIRGMIPYSEFVEKLTAVPLQAHDPRLFSLLDEVSTEEDEAGRGMLSVVVVHKDGDTQPGPGFFELAKRRGKDTSDVLVCWINELHKVHAYWSTQATVDPVRPPARVSDDSHASFAFIVSDLVAKEGTLTPSSPNEMTRRIFKFISNRIKDSE